MRNKKHERYYHAMLLPGMILLLIFSIIPMFGIVIAFQKFVPAKGIFGSGFIGLDNFRLLFLYPDVKKVIMNTVIIAVAKIILGIIVPVFFALLLNEVRSILFKRTIQTIVYLPYFLSWVILAVMFTNIFSYSGMVNKALAIFDVEPVMFMISNKWFRTILISTDVWKGFGYGAIIYIAAMTNISPNLYEAAEIDGGNRWHKIIYITIPSILPTIILMATLSLGDVLNAGFEQVFTMYSPLVFETSDIIDTYVYRMGLENMQYGFSTAVGLFKSVVSFALITFAYKLADRFAGYSIF